ncbi:transglutaminase domain-containing protein [Patescibacteria group bacterium]
MNDLATEIPNNEAERISNIEIDEVTEINDYCETIINKTEREKLDAVGNFLKNHLINALKEGVQMAKEVEQRVFNQEKPKKLSQVLEDKWGVCLDWNAVGKAMLDKLGIENVFRTGQYPGGPKHTYLDVKINDNWEIFDPFAEQYIKDNGGTGTRFQWIYYIDSNAEKKD